jgi:hypothetical protein
MIHGRRFSSPPCDIKVPIGYAIANRLQRRLLRIIPTKIVSHMIIKSDMLGFIARLGDIF